MKKVYIILLNHNGVNDTIECLESVLKLSYANFQVIVVDNSTTDNDLKVFSDWANGEKKVGQVRFENLVYPLSPKPADHIFVSEGTLLSQLYAQKIIFVKADSNSGFSAGNNVGLKYVLKFEEEESYAWLLNNDTVVEKDSLAELVLYSEKERTYKTGILGCRLLYYNAPQMMQAAGGKFDTRLYISSHVGEGMPFNAPKEDFDVIDYVVGASMFVSSVFVKEVGMLSEDYFLYYEELDWTVRAKKAGWNVDWCPDAVVYHKEGATIGSSYRHKKSLFSEEHLIRSRKIFVKKFYRLSFMFYFTALLLAVNRLRKGNFKAAAAVLKITFLQ